MLGFESADHPVDAWIERAVELARDHGGTLPEPIASSGPPTEAERRGGRCGGRDGAVGAWRNSFLRAPYTRDALVRMSVIVETFETACTWDRFDELHAGVTEAVATRRHRDLRRRLRHLPVHPRLPRRPRALLQRARAGPARFASSRMWDEIKVAASEALLAARRRPSPTTTPSAATTTAGTAASAPTSFGRALAAAKAELDPAGILNPGVPPRPLTPVFEWRCSVAFQPTGGVQSRNTRTEHRQSDKRRLSTATWG